MFPNSVNPQMFDNSEAIAVIEVVILLTISSSIDIKNNYFANSWSSNAGSLEVGGFLYSSYGVNIHQEKKIHAQLQMNKSNTVQLHAHNKHS